MTLICALPGATCLDLVRSSRLGRVAIAGPHGPEIVPVDVVVVGDALVFATDPHSVLGRFADGAALALEVDRLDPERWQGWSVVARGVGRRRRDDAAVPSDHRRRPVSWTTGDRTAVDELRWRELTGRRVAGAPVPAG